MSAVIQALAIVEESKETTVRRANDVLILLCLHTKRCQQFRSCLRGEQFALAWVIGELACLT